MLILVLLWKARLRCAHFLSADAGKSNVTREGIRGTQYVL